MFQAKATGTTRKNFAFRLNALASFDLGDKLCVGVPVELKMVYLDVHNRKKEQSFQENLQAISDYTGLDVDDSATIRMFIVDMKKTPIKIKGSGSSRKIEKWCCPLISNPYFFEWFYIVFPCAYLPPALPSLVKEHILT